MRGRRGRSQVAQYPLIIRFWLKIYSASYCDIMIEVIFLNCKGYWALWAEGAEGAGSPKPRGAYIRRHRFDCFGPLCEVQGSRALGVSMSLA